MVKNSYLNDLPFSAKKFFKQLEKNNDRAWFEAHKDEYIEKILEPSKFFVEVMGMKLKDFVPGMIADPRVNKSLFRINRDIRFSKDKSPYKTNTGILFWEGPFGRTESSGLYVHMDTDRLFIGCGLYIFPKPVLKAYREAFEDGARVKSLARAVSAVTKEGFEVGGKHYKRMPQGIDPNLKIADLALHNGLFAHQTIAIDKALRSVDLVDFCVKRFREALPLHKWLVALTERVAGGR